MVNFEPIVAYLKALPGKEITTKAGDRKIFHSAYASQEFWSAYKADKNGAYKAGLSCSKNNDMWYMNLWENVEPVIELDEATIKIIQSIRKPLDVSRFANTNLYDYQQEHAAYLYNSLEEDSVALDCSSTGTGKTFVALNVAKAMGKSVFIICPKPTIYGWINSAKSVGVKIEGIANYELARNGKMLESKIVKGQTRYVSTECHQIQKEDKKEFNINFPGNVLVIFDEVHRCKNPKTQNTALLIAMKRENVNLLMLSATPAESPLHFFGIGYALGLFAEPHYMYRWSQQYNCKKGKYAWEFRGGKAEMAAIRNEIGSKMHGMDVNALIQAGKFPETKILCENLYMNSSAEKIQALYEEWAEELRSLTAKIDETKEKKAHAKSPLALRQKYHQLIELEKLPYVKEMIEDALEEGKSVAVFCNYTETIHQLSELFKCSCLYNGEQSAEQNENNRKAFFENREHLIIGNIAAMREGIDLHDLTNEHERLAILFPAPYAQGFKQALGRVHRSGGHYSVQKIAYCAGTVEEQIASKVLAKLDNMDELTDIESLILNSI